MTEFNRLRHSAGPLAFWPAGPKFGLCKAGWCKAGLNKGGLFCLCKSWFVKNMICAKVGQSWSVQNLFV